MTGFYVGMALLSVFGYASSGFVAWFVADGEMENLMRRTYGNGPLVFVVPLVAAVMSIAWPWIPWGSGAGVSIVVAVLVSVISVALNVVSIVIGARLAKKQKLVREAKETA